MLPSVWLQTPPPGEQCWAEITHVMPVCSTTGTSSLASWAECGHRTRGAAHCFHGRYMSRSQVLGSQQVSGLVELLNVLTVGLVLVDWGRPSSQCRNHLCYTHQLASTNDYFYDSNTWHITHTKTTFTVVPKLYFEKKQKYIHITRS